MVKKDKKDPAAEKYALEVGGILKEFFTGPCSAIVTFNDWKMGDDGSLFLYAFCARWKLVTDAMWPIANFRSSERWQLLATGISGEVLAIFPGCKVQSIVMCQSTEVPQRLVEQKNTRIFSS